MSDYPNREHKNADEAARRRARSALDEILGEATDLVRRLYREDAAISDRDTQRLANLARTVTVEFAFLGALYEVREWHAADVADAAREAGQ